MQIKTHNITYIYDKKGQNETKAVDNVSITIKSGEFIAIIGESGSGKTTFIEHLNGLIRPSEGYVEIISREIASKMKKNKKLLKQNKKISDVAITIKPGKRKMKDIKVVRKHIGIVFQFAEYQLFEETILKDIIFGPVTMGVPKEEAKKLAKKYINLVGLDESFLKESPFDLSGGQKRRVALAGILAMEPEILIFDEPTAGLDPHGEKEMYEIFHKLNKIGKTIVIVTHNMDHVLEHSQRTILFKNGKVIKDGRSVDIMYNEKLLKQNELEVPKIVDLINDLNKNGKKIIERPTNIDELVKVL